MQKQLSIHLDLSGDMDALRDVLTLLHEQAERQQWLSQVESAVPSEGKCDDATSAVESFEQTGVFVAVHEPPHPSERVYVSESDPHRFEEHNGSSQLI
jgi:hypothetical protein